MNTLLATMVLVLASSTGTFACIVEDMPAPSKADEFDASMRAIMLAHAPIEYRKSCGLRDDSDTQFYEAIRLGVGCESSEVYDEFFRSFLNSEEYLMAVGRTDLRTDADFEKYCQIVERIDLNAAVTKDGRVNSEALKVQAPLFYALQELVATQRLK